MTYVYIYTIYAEDAPARVWASRTEAYFACETPPLVELLPVLWWDTYMYVNEYVYIYMYMIIYICIYMIKSIHTYIYI